MQKPALSTVLNTSTPRSWVSPPAKRPRRAEPSTPLPKPRRWRKIAVRLGRLVNTEKGRRCFEMTSLEDAVQSCLKVTIFFGPSKHEDKLIYCKWGFQVNFCEPSKMYRDVICESEGFRILDVSGNVIVLGRSEDWLVMDLGFDTAQSPYAHVLNERIESRRSETSSFSADLHLCPKLSQTNGFHDGTGFTTM